MSARKSLRAQLDAARQEAYLDLRAVAFDDLYVRCRPLTRDELKAALARPDEVEQSIDVLSSTCLGIWQEDGGKGVSPIDGFSGVIDLDTGHLSGDLPTFASPELAVELGVDANAGAVVRALLAPRSDLTLDRLSTELLEWSAGSNESVTRTVRPS